MYAYDFLDRVGAVPAEEVSDSDPHRAKTRDYAVEGPPPEERSGPTSIRGAVLEYMMQGVR